MPRGVWLLGLVSLFMDVSSEMIHAVLPLFVVGTLGASAANLGLIEGLAEATAQIAKVFSGTLSDRWQSRKWLAFAGYGLAAVVKPLFPLAGSAGAVFVARFLDRIGKGIRGAPRDAMIADMTPPDMRGAAFGLRQSLDTIGAFAGPLIAMAAMAFYAADLRTVLWLGVVPALLSVAILGFLVREPERVATGPRKPGFDLATARQLGRGFWIVTGLAGLIMLARFSEAFLVLKAQDQGLANQWVPLVMVVMSLVYSVAAYPAGVLADRWGRKGLLLAGLGLLVAADLVLGVVPGTGALFAGVALWGLHMGLTQGILTALVADHVPAHLRGTGFGLFNLVSGVALLIASLGAGMIWDRFGPGATFLTGAGLAAVALIVSGGVAAGEKNHAAQRDKP